MDHFLGEAERSDQGMKFFPDGRYTWPSGAILAWNETTRRCWLCINGDSLDVVGSDNWWVLEQELVRTFAGRCTRVDVAADFSRDLLTMNDVHVAGESGNFAGYRVTTATVERDRKKGVMGDMRTFGRRGKDGKGAYVRVYDKGLESGGEIDTIRVEVEFSGDLAGGSNGDNGRVDGIGLILADCGSKEKFAEKLARLIIGHVDFVDRSKGNGHYSRMERLGWWARIVELLGKESITVVAGRFKPSIERKVNWLKQQVSGSLAMVKVFCDSVGVCYENAVAVITKHGESRMDWDRPHKLDLGYSIEDALPGLGAMEFFGGHAVSGGM
jgi:DNA relaxase NicK